MSVEFVLSRNEIQAGIINTYVIQILILTTKALYNSTCIPLFEHTRLEHLTHKVKPRPM